MIKDEWIDSVFQVERTRTNVSKRGSPLELELSELSVYRIRPLRVEEMNDE